MGLISKVIVEIDGEEIKNFVALTIRQNIFSHHEFEIRYRKEKFEEPDSFPMEKSKKFIGANIKVEIEAYSDQLKQAKPVMFFKGIITEVRASKSGMAQNDFVVLSGFSPDILLQDNPGCNSFTDLTLKQIVEKVLSPYPKDMVRYKVNPSSTNKYPFIVQYNESRYDFIRRLAVRFGEWFYYDGLELNFGPPPDKSVDLNLGGDLSDFGFSIKLNPLNLKYITYDSSTAGPVESSSTKSSGANNLNDYGNLAHQKSMKLFNQNSVRLYDHLNSEQNRYNQESDSVVELTSGGIALDMSVGTGKSLNPEIKLGEKVMIRAFQKKDKGKTDYGEYIVTSITHTCDNLNNYKNEFTCIPSKAKLPNYTDPMAFPHCEPQYAVVTNNNDPDKLGRVKVRFFWQTNGAESPWLRLANPHAGPETGFFFVPEVNDEVMAGFESGDAEKPYILGSLYNGKHKPAVGWGSSGNDFKAIRTRSGNTIELIDAKGREEIVIYQENNKSAAHHISLAAGSDPTMSIFSKGKLIIEAKSIQIKTNQGSIEIKSQQDIAIKGSSMDMTADSDIKITGMNVDIEANAQLKNSGGMVKVESSGVTSVTGSIVKIN